MKKEIVKKGWVEMNSPTRTFQYGDEPELIHIIKTGFKDRYMIVWEDAYELNIGKVEFCTASVILSVYGIKINEDFHFDKKKPDWLTNKQLREIVEVAKTKKIKALKMLKELAEPHMENSFKWSLDFLRELGIMPKHEDANTE